MRALRITFLFFIFSTFLHCIISECTWAATNWITKHPTGPPNVVITTSTSSATVAVDENNPLGPAFRLHYTGDTPPTVSGQSSTFSMSCSSGICNIEFLRQLDYELSQVEILIVICGTATTSGFLRTMTVSLRDLNDNPPYFISSPGRLSFNENKVGILDGKLCGSDNDETSKANLFFDVTVDGSPSAKFKMTSLPGETCAQVQVVQPLDFEDTTSYLLQIYLKDGLFSATQYLPLSVVDQPDELPQWSKFYPVIQISEDSGTDLEIRKFSARDGDLGVNRRMIYTLETGETVKLVIDASTGSLRLSEKVDRDTAGSEVYAWEFTVVATEDIDGLLIKDTVILTISDVNDNVPEFTNKGALYTSAVQENFVGELSFNFPIIVTDKDFSTSGSYSAAIMFDDPSLDNDKLQILSTTTGTASGSQVTEYRIRNLDPTFFDYELANRRKISFKVIVTEDADPSHSNSENFEITVSDVNDNAPKFLNEPAGGYVVTVIESTAVGTPLDINFEVVDDDVTPEFGVTSVRYQLNAGVLEGKIRIDEKTGIINLIQAVDREQFSTPVQVTVTVADMGGASPDSKAVTKAVRVTIGDVNDEKPRLTLPLTVAEIPEGDGLNPPGDGSVVTSEIVAEDSDLQPSLTLSIDWANTKFYSNSAEKPESVNFQYQDYFQLETVPDRADKISGRIRIGKYKPDRELFDTVELAITANDENTDDAYTVNKATLGKLFLRISDINDNSPVFISPETTLSITEELPASQTIARFRLEDKDLGQTVTLSIQQCDQAGLLKIDGFDLQTTQPIDYETDRTIRCTLMASDNASPPKTTPLQVTINVIDINDNDPQWGDFENSVEIDENRSTSQLSIAKVIATDRDSGVYGTITYLLPEAPNIDGGLDRFEVDGSTGDVRVKLQNGAKLDFEQRQSYSLTIEARDYYRPGVSSGSRTNTTILTISLKDKNDNPPIFQSEEKSCFQSPLESTLAGVFIGRVEATDADFLSENKFITYYLDSVEPNRPLFRMTNNGTLYADRTLTGNSGEYTLTVRGVDAGTPSLSGTGRFLICVTDINDNAPVITFPKNGEVLNVKETNPLGTVMYELGDGTSKALIVTSADADTELNAKVSYDIASGSNGAISAFAVDPNNGRVTLLKQLDPTVTRKYNVTIRARDQGTPSLSTENLFTIVVVGVGDHLPEFPTKTTSANILENEVSVMKPFAEATDIDNNGLEPSDELFQKLCYFIVGGDKTLFEIPNKEQAVFRNTVPLNREDPAQANLYILIMVKADDCTVQPPDQENTDRKDILRINIIIDDVNDEPPKFESSITAGLTPDYKNQDVVTTIVAHDPDENELLTYAITSTITASDPSIQGYVNPFQLGAATGILKVQFSPNLEMKGYFTFEVTATDMTGQKVTTNVKIYMVGAEHEYLIIFSNDLKEVEPKTNEIQKVFSDVLGKRCNIQKVSPTDAVGIGNSSQVTAHFVDESKNLPIPYTEVTQLLSAGNTSLEIKRRLLEPPIELLLVELRPKTPPTVNETEEIFMILFIVISVILGLLVIAISSIHFVRVSRLKRQVKALSTTQFGSMDSGLNRAGMGLPNTNRFAEGANPVWNVDDKKIRSDNASISSGDSVLIGVEDNPEFKNYKGGLANPGFTSNNGMPKNPMFGVGLEERSTNSQREYDSDTLSEDGNYGYNEL